MPSVYEGSNDGDIGWLRFVIVTIGVAIVVVVVSFAVTSIAFSIIIAIIVAGGIRDCDRGFGLEEGEGEC